MTTAQRNAAPAAGRHSENVAYADFYREMDGNADYDTLVNIGIEAMQNLDAHRYVIGDLACKVVKEYGQDTLGEFATHINCRKATCAEYRRVCAFFARELRAEFRESMPTLSYSILRESMRLKELPAVLDFLRECADEALTWEQANIRMNERLGKPVAEKLLDVTTGDFVCSWTRFEVFCEISTEIAQRLSTGKSFRFVIYESKE